MRRMSKQIEQRELKGTITANTLRRQSLRGAVKRMIANIPSTENFPNLYPHRALNQANTVFGAASLFIQFLYLI